MMRIFLPTALRGLVAACALAGLISGAPAVAQEVKIGVLYPIKTMLGQQGRNGAEIAAEMINANGGVLDGRPLKLVVYDDNYQPADAVAAARKLLSEDKVPVIVGAINTAVSLGVTQVAQQGGAMFLAAVTKAPQVTEYDRAFRFNPLVATDGQVFNQYLKDKVKPQRMAVVVENGDYGRSIIASMKESFGSAVVATELYEILKQTDFSTLASRVKAANPDVVCMAFSAPEQGGSLLRTLAEAGVKAKRCILPGSVSPALLQVAGPAAEGAFTLDIWAPTMNTETNRKFVAAYHAKHKAAPGKVDFLGFESMWILGQAIRSAGTVTDTAKLATTLRQGTWDSPRGQVKFPANQATSDKWVVLEVKDGKITVNE
ncbi:ABC transporter substrate-binding protein [Variovorax sp. KK3]|uniref:ABC transporter substrate-binding protein n=1 Tax=Variovorax sp. KK3 TaxID=1855728 RepID=UPI00097C3452|nr:ABC transporter substrate-binding protein [Variovorax sp. KK3]